MRISQNRKKQSGENNMNHYRKIAVLLLAVLLVSLAAPAYALDTYYFAVADRPRWSLGGETEIRFKMHDDVDVGPSPGIDGLIRVTDNIQTGIFGR